MWLAQKKSKAAPPSLNDPTAEYQPLKAAILGDRSVVDYLANLRAKRVALALSGGGGKGAYEAGVILALLDCGLNKFCAVAGTSVGALNAALCVDACQTGSRERLLRTWCEISPWKVMHPTLSTLASIPSTLAIYLSLLFFYLSGTPPINDPDERPMDVAALSGGRGVLQSLWVQYKQELKRTLRRTGYVVLGSLGMLYYTRNIQRWLGHTPGSFEYILPPAALILLATVLASSKNWIGSRLSLMSNAPLRRTIAEFDIQTLRESSTPIYCTLANVASYWSPFHTEELSSKVVQRRILIPVYVLLSNAESNTEAVEFLLHSAALPEIFPARPIRELYFSDGGLADNSPIYPVLQDNPDIVFCVYLRRSPVNEEELKRLEEGRLFGLDEAMARANRLHNDEIAGEIRRKWTSSRTWWAMKQSAPDRDPPFANPFPDRDPNRPTLLPTTTDYLGKVGFVPVMPSEPIDRWPRLLTGTLNFSSKKARWLTGLGYRDALARIKSEADRQASG